jgi:hypothetical protein
MQSVPRKQVVYFWQAGVDAGVMNHDAMDYLILGHGGRAFVRVQSPASGS